MANTLETKTPEQLTAALQSYNSYMCEIPDNFTVLDEYLNGLTTVEFCGAFIVLQKIVIDIYKYLIENPQAVGLVKKNKKTGELEIQTTQHISCVKKLLYTIGRFSTLESNSLIIDINELMNAYMTYYPNISVELSEKINEYDKNKQSKFFESKNMRSVFLCLEKFGFELNGIDTDINKINSITIRYPKQPFVINVIKAFALPRVCRISFGFDFTKFNYRVFAHKSDEIVPLEDLYSFHLIPNEHKKFLSVLNQALNEIGADYGECESGWYNGTLPCQYIYKNKVRILQNVENGLMPHVVMWQRGKPEIVIKKPAKVIDLFKLLPDKNRNIIGKCHGCTKGECGRRNIVSANDKKYVVCAGGWWGFPPEVDVVPFIVKAYKI
jgi:hypothetical protein